MNNTTRNIAARLNRRSLLKALVLSPLVFLARKAPLLTAGAARPQGQPIVRKNRPEIKCDLGWFDPERERQRWLRENPLFNGFFK